MSPRIALAQIEVVAGMPERNVASILSMIARAKDAGADAVVFPEMCVGGYLLGDRFLDDNFCRELMRYNQTLIEASDGIAVAWGNIFLDDAMSARGIHGYHPNKDGRIRRYNAIYVAQDRALAPRKIETSCVPAGIQAKTLLPNYRFFDDERYFFSLADVALDFNVPLASLMQPFLIKTREGVVPIGFELCEDLWCEDYRLDHGALNVTEMLIKNGARYIANASASPWTFGKNNARDRRVLFLKKNSGASFVPFLYVNVVGAQNNGKNVITFDGGSTVYNANGELVQVAAKAYEETLLVADRFDSPPVARVEDAKIAQKHRALLTGIRHVKNFRGRTEEPRVIIGLSGGVDSAVAAALLVEVCGKENVLGVNMPTKYNSSKTINAAKKLASELGITYHDVPIGELVDVNNRLLNEADLDGRGVSLSVLNEENVQAKIRGTSLLSNLAAKYHGIFSNNGNKLEIALGYATLYGDWGGAISVLGDLTKAEVYQLALYLNEHVFHREVIPESLIPDALFRFREDQIAPSAELKDDQIDPMKFGYHCAMLDAFTDYKKRSSEDMMRWFLEGTLHTHLGIDVELIRRWGVDQADTFLEDLRWFSRNVRGAVFKRVQSPPIIVTSKSAYGYDIRESILPDVQSSEEKRLEAEIQKTRPVYQPSR
jgi:NAD+ synthase (glutamine-hydrolysing)